MTNTRILWLIEDDNLKGRTIVRIVQKLRPDLEVVRLHTLQEWLDVLFPRDRLIEGFQVTHVKDGCIQRIGLQPGARPQWAGVITDWHFPHRYGESAQPLGDRVLESLDGAGIPRVVVSGADRPADFQKNWGTFQKNWEAIDWLTWGDSDALRAWLLDL